MSELKSQERAYNPANLFIWMVGTLLALGAIYDGIDYIWGKGWALDELRTIVQLVIVDDDSWWPMYNAAKARLLNAGVYQTVFFEERMKFQYPPLSILPFIIFIKIGMSWETIREVMNAISFASILLMVAIVYSLIVILFKRFPISGKFDWKYKIPFFVISLIGTFSFDAIVRAQYLGQIQVILDLLVCLAFLLLLLNQKYFSGACLALAALVKPQLILLFLWALIRKEKEIMIGMIAVFVPAGALSLYVFGFSEHVQYLETLSLMGKHGEAYWPNQSINGLLHRLLSDVDALTFPVNSYAPYNPFIYGATIVTTVMLILLGLFFRPESSSRGLSQDRKLTGYSLDMATMLLLVTMASPIAWYHHYGIVWPFYVAAFVVLCCLRSIRRSWQTIVIGSLLSASFLLLSNRFPALTSEAFSAPPINLLLSHYLFGAFLFLAALLMLRRTLAGEYRNN
ncbi:DUF2029 domain-containing protein [Sneathiella sp. CAU 1612]|uniref:DUF2029 domain-containing protein n=1 Tax=Sneathiella sedimenti TaxID=2816034 RepID=A0ABS3F5P8_9PROT|nr:glycosyltransferase family 87 protein [Sneathiella sedimenti]MBO0333830.1 DUF2029 domain-containing protein [Sneathiella sedimenti]